MTEPRPNPDELLARIRAEEAQNRRGALKIYFGYAAGVGKTYSMLEDARRAQAAGRDVVVGYVEPHSRPETEALLPGLPLIPPRTFDYRGMRLREVDVDAILERRPALVLIDELAHTNAAGSRHAKRWQDVEEILAAGIDVWTTLNVQHLESLNDVIGGVTGVIVSETIPDRIFESAQELELVDLPPDDLLARLRAGKVYVPEQAQRALQSFFQRANLSALRELSLRQAARRVHTEVESARRQRAVPQPWATGERLLVCIGPSPTTARVIRTAKRMAGALDAPWLAVSVDLPGADPGSPAQAQIAEHFRLAERLGAETATICGDDVVDAILEYARRRNVTKIILGKTNQPRWKRLLLGTVVDQMLEHSGDIDVYVIHGEEDQAAAGPRPPPPPPWDSAAYLGAAAAVAAAAGLAYGPYLLRMAEANTVMIFLAAVAFVAYQLGRGPAIFASVLAVLVFDFFFVPPYLTFAVADAQYVVTFAVMLAIGMVISALTSRLKSQLDSSRLRELRAAALYELGKQLSSLYGKTFLASATGAKIAELVDGEAAIYLRQAAGPPEVVFGHETSIARHPLSQPVAQWVVDHDQRAGAGTSTLPGAVALFLPLTGSQQTLGAIAIRTEPIDRWLGPDERLLLESCAGQLALALERDQLAIEAAEARIQAEAEQVRNTLLSSVSHDLKTPLAAIAGASSSLRESPTLSHDAQRQLLDSISLEAVRLNRLLENLLQMSQLDAGAVLPNKQWHVLEEIVGSALLRCQRELQSHPVELQIPADLPLVWVDELLVEQLLGNLLENAARYTPPGTRIQLAAATLERWLQLTVSDEGPGIPPGLEEKIFDKFFRATRSADSSRGSGLGLAICRAIAQVHGGTIAARNRPAGGAEFIVRLPLRAEAPLVPLE